MLHLRPHPEETQMKNPNKHGENDIIPAVMEVLKQRRAVQTSYLVEVVPGMLPLTDHDKEILPSRSDARITQIIRNLVSHRKLVRMKLATYQNRRLVITPKGMKYGEAA